MLKRYLPFLLLGPAANVLWAWWALPQMGEQGTFLESLEWIAVQSLLPLFFGLLLSQRRRYVFWMLLVYSGWILLFGVGTLGWALIGSATPFAVYAVCLLFLGMGFGLLFHALKDLKIGERKRTYGLEDE